MLKRYAYALKTTGYSEGSNKNGVLLYSDPDIFSLRNAIPVPHLFLEVQ